MEGFSYLRDPGFLTDRDPVENIRHSRWKQHWNLCGIHVQHGLYSREGREFESDRTQAFAVTPKIFYFKGFLDVHKDDILIDSEDVYIIYTFQHHRGVKGHQAFTRCVCPDLKLNKMNFLKMFKEVLNEYLHGKNKNQWVLWYR